MLHYLTKLLESGDAFTVTVWLHGGRPLRDCGVLAVDAGGLVVQCDGKVVALPWTSVDRVFPGDVE